MAWVACIATSLVVAGLSADRLAAQAPPVTHERVAGDVWRIDGAIDVIVVQHGPDGLLMVDTGYPFAQAGVEAALLEISGGQDPELLINTHYHHAFSNHLYGTDAEIVAHANVSRRMASTNLMGGQVVPPMPEAGRPDRTFTDSLTLSFNGEDVTLLHMPGAHTDGDVVVIFHGSGVVVTGDVYVPQMPWTDMDAGGDFAQLLPAVERLLEVVPRDAVVVPGHGPSGTYEDLVAYRDMLVSAQRSIDGRRSEGMGLRHVQALGLPDLAEWRGPAVPEPLFIENVYRASVPVRRTPDAPTLTLENGRWFDGAGFTGKVMYSVDGVLTEVAPARSDRVVDLEGGWVVPPFGEAHTHHMGNRNALEEQGGHFIDDGVFYVMVQDPASEIREEHREYSARPTTVDVAYTQGVVTPSWGVITDMYGLFVGMGMYGEDATLDDIVGKVFFRVDTVEDLEREWPVLEAKNDRFVKVILAFTDELEQRRADPERYGAQPPQYSGKPGLTPEVFRALVPKAHEAGLMVSAHIENRADFRLAVDAGADLIAHLPAAWQIGEGTGYAADDIDPWVLTQEDVIAARRAGTVVVTTAVPTSLEDPRLELFNEVHTRNLEMLSRAGVKLVVGSDQFTRTSVAEVLYLETLGVFSDDALFRLLSVQTPRFIFPERRIGHLREGYEASFLVLGGNPLEDLGHIQDIRVRVKNGNILDSSQR